jgi:hypothetical protein
MYSAVCVYVMQVLCQNAEAEAQGLHGNVATVLQLCLPIIILQYSYT